MKSAGLVSSATAVAARRSARHWLLELAGLLGGEPSDDRCRAHLRSVDVTKLTYFDVKASDSFAAAEIERARRYHRPLYLALLVDWALQLAVLAAIAFGPPGDWLWSATGGPWWARTLELTALVLAVSDARAAAALGLARLGVGAALEASRRSRLPPGLGTWPRDWSSGAVLTGLALTAARLVGAGLADVVAARGGARGGRAHAAAEPARAAAVRAALQPLRAARGRGARPRPARAVGARGRAGADDARRRREPPDDQAQRVRLRARPDEAARPLRHAAATTPRCRSCAAWSPTSSATGASATSRAGLRSRRSARSARCWRCGSSSRGAGCVAAAGADGPGDPRIVPLVLLVLWVLEIGALPFETWLSRRWERVADRFAVELTRDPETMERMHRRLALANLADLDPPRPVYLLLFTHPTPPERIAAASNEHDEPLARATPPRARPLAIALGLILGLMVGEVVVRRRRRLARAARRRRPHAHRRRRARPSPSARSRSPAAPRAGAGRSASAASRSSPRT